MKTHKVIKISILIIALSLIMYLLFDMFGNAIMPQEPHKKIKNLPVATTVIPKEELSSVQLSPLLPEKPTNDFKQTTYLDSLDELKQLQLLERIEIIKQSIAKTKLEQRQTQKELLALNEVPAPSVIEHTIPGETIAAKQTFQKPSNNSYVLLYVANENGRWQAILGLSDKFYNVEIGTSLPDGSTVLDITSTAITLEKKGEKQMLSITPVMS